MRQYLSGFFSRIWQETEQASISYLSGRNRFSADWKIIIILVYTAVGVTIARYYGNTAYFLNIIVNKPTGFDLWYCSFFFGSESGKFHSMLYWAGFIVIFYLLFPALIVRFLFRESLKDYGFRLKGIHKDYPLYVLMLVIMLPIVFFISYSPSFQERYPLFQPSKATLMPIFLYWQIAYLLQFVAVEFFFRGFILHGIKSRFGLYSIFVMTVPYCMVHFGKPMAETLAAIPAGIVLGTVSLKSRSIVLGILIHYSVAISMDIFALWREGYFLF